jgi:peroxiredoxin
MRLNAISTAAVLAAISCGSLASADTPPIEAIPPSVATSPMTGKVGMQAPLLDWKLKNVDGKELSIADVRGSKGTLVVFTCNACPFVKAWEDRIVALGNGAKARGVGVIAVNANDPKRVAEDGFEQMQARAKDKGFAFPYAFDAGSRVARAFGAQRTPEAFLLDANGIVVYHGAVDDNAQDASGVKESYLRDALDALVAGKEIAVKETKALGCTIKWQQ